MFCRNCGNQMDNNAVVCVKCGVPRNVGNRFCQNCGQQTPQEAVVCVNCGVALAQNPVAQGEQKSKIAAGLLGIFLGSFGIHNFYLGFTTKAVIQLVVSVVGGIVTCGLASLVVSVWGLVEGVMILTGSIDTDANGVPLKD